MTTSACFHVIIVPTISSRISVTFQSELCGDYTTSAQWYQQPAPLAHLTTNVSKISITVIIIIHQQQHRRRRRRHRHDHQERRNPNDEIVKIGEEMFDFTLRNSTSLIHNPCYDSFEDVVKTLHWPNGSYHFGYGVFVLKVGMSINFTEAQWGRLHRGNFEAIYVGLWASPSSGVRTALCHWAHRRWPSLRQFWAVSCGKLCGRLYSSNIPASSLGI